MMWCFPWCLLLSWVLSKGQCSIWRSLEHLRLVRFEIPHGFARAPTEPLLMDRFLLRNCPKCSGYYMGVIVRWRYLTHRPDCAFVFLMIFQCPRRPTEAMNIFVNYNNVDSRNIWLNPLEHASQQANRSSPLNSLKIAIARTPRCFLSLAMIGDDPLCYKVVQLSDRQVKALSGTTFLYSGLFLTEGVGLWLEKTWAHTLTIIVTISFIPLEIFELCKEI